MVLNEPTHLANLVTAENCTRDHYVNFKQLTPHITYHQKYRAMTSARHKYVGLIFFMCSSREWYNL